MQCCCVHLCFVTCLEAEVLLQKRDVCAAEYTHLRYKFIYSNCYLPVSGFGHIEVAINAEK